MAVNPQYPGPKQAGPDGERYRLKDAAFYDYALKFCLNCKRCEVACPSGVQVGDLISSAKCSFGHSLHPLRDFALASTDLVGGVASAFAPLANATLALKPVSAAMDSLMAVDHRRVFPKYSSQKFVSWFKKSAPDQSSFKRSVSYFHGCYVNYNFPQLGRDTLALLNACGYGVRLLDKEKCCGVALLSNGFKKQASRNALVNMNSVAAALSSGSEAVVTSSSSCTFMMRDEYPHLLDVDNSSVRDSIMLLTRFLYEKISSGVVKLAFKQDYKARYAYHTACHMQRMGWSVYSIGLLKMIPGLDLVVLPQECCGIAGTFGFKKENYDFSQSIGSKLFEHISESGVAVVVTDCETCKWQIEMSTSCSVQNPISVLLDAIDLKATFELNR